VEERQDHDRQVRRPSIAAPAVIPHMKQRLYHGGRGQNIEDPPPGLRRPAVFSWRATGRRSSGGASESRMRHRSDKAVTAAGNGLDTAALVSPLIEYPTKRRDLSRQVAVLDEAVLATRRS
jgi:hypothetical protein